MAVSMLCGRRCLNFSTSHPPIRNLSYLSGHVNSSCSVETGVVPVRHAHQNSWLMNYTLEELHYSASGGAVNFMRFGRGGGKGAPGVKVDEIQAYHDQKSAKLGEYALPGINVPQDVLKFPARLSSHQLKEIRAKFEPRMPEDADDRTPVKFDISCGDDLRRWKWHNRFNTHRLLDARNPPVVPSHTPTFFPGGKAQAPFEPVLVRRFGVGFTGGTRAGQTLGPPESHYLDPDLSADFQSVLIECTKVTHSIKTGRIRGFRAIVAVGNGNGLVGVETATSTNMRIAAKNARNRAFHKLQHVELADNHTIFRNMNVRKGKCRLMFLRQPPGYGVKCHRIARAICILAGVKNVYAKLHGSRNPLSIVYATMKALTCQLNHQEFADETKKHVIELRREFNYRPIVVASPKNAREKPSPLLRLTKKPYTGVVPLPAENALRVWYQNLDVLEPGTKKFSEELWEKNEVKEEESEASD